MILLPSHHPQNRFPPLLKAGYTVALLTLMLTGSIAYAASVAIQVVDAAGQAVTNAAIYAEAITGQAAPKQQLLVEIEQKGRKFTPLLTVIQTGSEISFPNRDTVRHHVYSFSSAKMFELKLYSGVPGNPVVFDKAGTVVVGCNIHDQMAAYIHVVNTPYFTKTDAAGKAKLEDLPPGKYRLKAWHFNLPTDTHVTEQAINLSSRDIAASFMLPLKRGAVVN